MAIEMCENDISNRDNSNVKAKIMICNIEKNIIIINEIMKRK